MSRNKVYFLSDLHLGASYISDAKEHERKIVSFLQSVSEDAERIYLLGDILDYWFEYKTVVPRGYIRFFGTLASLADQGVKITWFIGNHDIWLFDYLKNEIGMDVVDGFEVVNIGGYKFFLSHGDGVGKLRPGFKFIRGIFRNKFCQKLFSGIHPRWTVGFAHSWSKHSRGKGSPQYFLGENEPQIVFAKEYLQKHSDISYFVFGHRHIAKDYPLTDKCRLIMLGDCFNQFTYAVFDGKELSLNSFL